MWGLKEKNIPVPKELPPDVRKRIKYAQQAARREIRMYGITRHLGLDQAEDIALVTNCLAQRLLMLSIISNQSFLKQPKTEVARGTIAGPIFDKLESSSNEDSETLKLLENLTSTHIEAHYKTNPNRAKTIDQAVNFLVTTNLKRMPRNIPLFRPSSKTIKAWATEWRPKLANNE